MKRAFRIFGFRIMLIIGAIPLWLIVKLLDGELHKGEYWESWTEAFKTPLDL